jgi:hypothetical protein
MMQAIDTGVVEAKKKQAFAGEFLVLERALVANGALSVENNLPLALSRNAVIVSPFYVMITAGPADWITAASVAQIRQRDISGGGQSRTSVVVDFGMLRTVSGVGLNSIADFEVLQVRQWMGAGFAPVPIVTATIPSGIPFSSSVPPIDATTPKFTTTLGGEVIFPSEVRTDRLQIDLLGQGADEIKSTLLVQLPDPPADLDVRVNGGQPVWRSPGVVAAGAPGWNTGKGGLVHQVDLSAALSALLGDPTADKSAMVDIHIVLAARNPGFLKVDVPDPAARNIRYVAQIAIPSEPLIFASEGAVLLPLKLPAYATSLERISFAATASPPPERVMPPVGPDPAMTDGETPLAEMLLDPTHAACVALPQSAELGELVALRFPFRVEAGGAEMQVLLLDSIADGTPNKPIDGAVTKPVVLASGPDESWTTLALPRPLPLDGASIHALVLVKRGRVRWALAGAAGGSAGQVFTGPPKGPWQPLPPLGELAALRGRVRIVAHAKRGIAVAPFLVRAVGTSGNGQELSPTAKGITADISGPAAGLPVAPSPAKQVDLQVISRVAGSLNLRNVVVTVADGA